MSADSSGRRSRTCSARATAIPQRQTASTISSTRTFPGRQVTEFAGWPDESAGRRRRHPAGRLLDLGGRSRPGRRRRLHLRFAEPGRPDAADRHRRRHPRSGELHQHRTGFVTGTSKADTIYGGQFADRILHRERQRHRHRRNRGGRRPTEGGDDTVAWGTNTTRSLDFGGFAASNPAAFHLDGGRGLDTLSIDLSFTNQNLSLAGRLTATEFTGINVRLSNAAAAENFEYLGDVRTGGGDDSITQLGNHDNVSIREEARISSRPVSASIASMVALTSWAPTPATASRTPSPKPRATVSSSITRALGRSNRSAARPPSKGRGFSSRVTGSTPIAASITLQIQATRTSSHTSVSFAGMEGLTVTGSQGDDFLIGTNTVYRDLSLSWGQRQSRRRRHPLGWRR